MAIKQLNSWHYIQLKCLCIVKGTIDKVKRQPIKWEEVVAKHMSEIRLISKTNKELLQLNRQNKQPNLKIGQKS